MTEENRDAAFRGAAVALTMLISAIAIAAVTLMLLSCAGCACSGRPCGNGFCQGREKAYFEGVQMAALPQRRVAGHGQEIYAGKRPSRIESEAYARGLQAGMNAYRAARARLEAAS